jgi:hypothetical protein
MGANSKRKQRPSAAIDGLRVRMPHGDPLVGLPDSEREWVMRSLLKGIQQREVMRLAKMTEEQYERAVVRVRRWYRDRCQAYKALPKGVWAWLTTHARYCSRCEGYGACRVV